MIKRTVEISKPSYLHLRHQQMVVEQEKVEVGTVPIEDLGVLIVDHPAVSYTQGLITACWQNNVVVVLCDEKHLPGAIIQPLEAHTLHLKVLQQQMSATDPRKKRLWQQIVRAKIEAQAAVLRSVESEHGNLLEMAKRVRSGDQGNLEAQAARIYWPRLFGADFRRDRGAEGINVLLNYGYAIVRAAVARAISGAGLHPALSIFHNNQYNALALADDLMEPLRPLIDLRVREIHDSGAHDLNRENKARLLEVLSWPVRMEERKFPLMVALHHYVAHIRECLSGGRKSPIIPQI